jgi:imidazolonepropionase-like amidohydrolase
MIRHLLIILLSILTANAYSQTPFSIYALKGVTIIDANHKAPLSNQTILIEGNTIVNVFASESIKLADSVKILDLKGKFIIPGLINTHIHIDQEYEGKANRDSAEFYLKKMLYSGVTDVRDMAGDARFLASLSKDAMLGDIPSPDIYYSAGMSGPNFFKEKRTQVFAKGSVAGQMSYWKVVTDSTNLITAMAEAKGSGATGIKINADINTGLLYRMVYDAKKQGLQVWSHAYIFPATVMDAINAGVKVISHADHLAKTQHGDEPVPKAWKTKENPEHSDDYWDSEITKLQPQLDEMFTKMKKKDVIFDPTFCVFLGFKKVPNQDWRFEISKRVIIQAYKANVKICTGTDALFYQFTLQDEIKSMVTYCGVSPIDAIVSATKIGAEAIGIEKKCGTIESGKLANLIILDKNPIEDINNISSVNMVIKSGLIYK